MEIQWFSNSADGVVTLYETNITLNTVAANFFINAYSTLIGFDKENETLIIKCINKEEAMSGSYKEHELHPISIKKSYGRINGKRLISTLSLYFPLDFSKKSLHKFPCLWNELSKSLIVNLKEEIK